MFQITEDGCIRKKKELRSVLRQGDSPAGSSAADCRKTLQCTSCRRQTQPPVSPPLTVDWESGGEMLRIGGGEVGGAMLMLRLDTWNGSLVSFSSLAQFVGAICWIFVGKSPMTSP